MDYFVHEKGICESTQIGKDTRIWAFTHVLPQAQIGANCNICDHVFIENDVIIGDRVTIKCGVQIWDGIEIEDDVFIGPNVTFTNDRFPRSKQYPDKSLTTVIKHGASIGANATLLPGIVVGEHAMIGAGSVVLKPVPAHAIVVGNPAKIIGYSDTPKSVLSSDQKTDQGAQSTSVNNVTWHTFPGIIDLRGSLTVGEFEKDIPFRPSRYFLVFDVKSSEIRGEHAHKKCHQFLICVKGTCAVIADDGANREQFTLDQPTKGLYLPPMTWGIQYQYTSDAVLLVFASDFYDADDYIRDYEQFQKLAMQAK